MVGRSEADWRLLEVAGADRARFVLALADGGETDLVDAPSIAECKPLADLWLAKWGDLELMRRSMLDMSCDPASKAEPQARDLHSLMNTSPFVLHFLAVVLCWQSLYRMHL